MLFGTARNLKPKFPNSTQWSELIELDTKSRAYDQIPKLFENTNPQARIAFILHYPFHYFLYKNVYRHIAPEAEFVIDCNEIRRNVANWFELLAKFSEFLRSKGAAFRFFSSADLNLEAFFKQYDTLVASYAMPSIRLECNRAKTKIRMMYGHSKDVHNFGPWSRYFDLALTYGPYSQRRASVFVKSNIVGNPKFDDWFSGQRDDENGPTLQQSISSKRKSLLYLPTHGNLSSFEIVLPALRDFVNSYNIIIKPHHLTMYCERDRSQLLASLLEGGLTVVDDFADITELLQTSDVVLSDNSGAIFDAVLAEKPLVLLDFLDKTFFEEEQWRIKKRAPASWIFPMTSAKSIEQRIKHERGLCPGVVIRSIHELPAGIERAVQEFWKYTPNQRRLKEMLFSYCDGSAGRRAAAVIKKASGIRSIEKPPLAVSVDAEVAKERTYLLDEISTLRRTLSNYANLKPLYGPLVYSSPIAFSIVLPTFNRGRSILASVDAIVGQWRFEASHYEIIIVDDGSTDETTDVATAFIRAHSNDLVRYLKLSKTMGPATARNLGIAVANGEFVCFTDDDCIVPPQWLAIIRRAFRNHPEVAGVGGWRLPDTQGQNIYSSFIFLQDSNAIPWKRKSASFWGNLAGDTASMCYRKAILAEVGGFNPVFRYPSLEDWELKKRVSDKGYALLYTPSLSVRHRHPTSLRTFVRRYLHRGWGYFVLWRLHPGLTFYRYSLLRALHGIMDDALWITSLNRPLIMKLKLVALAALKNFLLWFGKYWGAFSLLSIKETTVTYGRKQ